MEDIENEEIEKFVSLEEVANDLKTGDLVFFQGWGIDSVLIRRITGGRWSHIGIIIEGKHVGCDDHRLLLFESTNRVGTDINSAYNDAEGQTTGVMLVDFDSRMEDYHSAKMYSKFGIKSLKSDKYPEINVKKLASFVHNENVRKSIYPAEYKVAVEHFVARELESKSFSTGMASRIKPRLNGETTRDISEEDLQQVIMEVVGMIQEDYIDDLAHDKINHSHAVPSHYFCSELVADTLMHMDIVETRNAARYSPDDFSNQSRLSVRDFFDDAICIPSSADKATEFDRQDFINFAGMIRGN